MMQTENYRKRASDVRRSARAHLVMLQRERLERRAALANEKVGQGAPVEGIDGADPAADQTQQEPLARPDASLHEPSSSGDDLDHLDELAIRNAAMSELSEASSHPIATGLEEPAHERPDDPMLHPEDSEANMELDLPSGAEDWRKSELADLPGAGPGLVWMLSQCDIFSLDDLSRQSATELSNRLGVVGQIIDVDRWIDFAKTKTKPPMLS